MLAALVEEAVTVGDLVRLLTLRQGQANLVEITLPPTRRSPGRPVRDCRCRRDAALVAILRGGRVIVPQPDDPLEPGDELMFVATERGRGGHPRVLGRTEAAARGTRRDAALRRRFRRAGAPLATAQTVTEGGDAGQRHAHRDADPAQPGVGVGVVEPALDDEPGPEHDDPQQAAVKARTTGGRGASPGPRR